MDGGSGFAGAALQQQRAGAVATTLRGGAPCGLCKHAFNFVCEGLRDDRRYSPYHRIVDCLLPLYGQVAEARELLRSGVPGVCAVTYLREDKLNLTPFLTSVARLPWDSLVDEGSACARTALLGAANGSTTKGTVGQLARSHSRLGSFLNGPKHSAYSADTLENLARMQEDASSLAGLSAPRIVLIQREGVSRTFRRSALQRLRGALQKRTDFPVIAHRGCESAEETVRLFNQAVGVVGFFGAAWANTLFSAGRHCNEQVSTYSDFESKTVWRITHEVMVNPKAVWHFHHLSLAMLLEDNHISSSEYSAAANQDELLRSLPFVPLHSADVEVLVASMAKCVSEPGMLQPRQGSLVQEAQGCGKDADEQRLHAEAAERSAGDSVTLGGGQETSTTQPNAEEERSAATKRQAEEAAAKRIREKEEEEAATARRREEEAAALRKRQEDEMEEKEEEAAAAKRWLDAEDEEAARQRSEEEEAAAANKQREEEEKEAPPGAAERRDETAPAEKLIEEDSESKENVTSKWLEEEGATSMKPQLAETMGARQEEQVYTYSFHKTEFCHTYHYKGNAYLTFPSVADAQHVCTADPQCGGVAQWTCGSDSFTFCGATGFGLGFYGDQRCTWVREKQANKSQPSTARQSAKRKISKTPRGVNLYPVDESMDTRPLFLRRRDNCSTCDVTVNLRCEGMRAGRYAAFHRVVECLLPMYGMVELAHLARKNDSAHVCALTWTDQHGMDLRSFLQDVVGVGWHTLVDENDACAKGLKYHAGYRTATLGARSSYLDAFGTEKNMMRAYSIDIASNLEWMQRDAARFVGSFSPTVIIIQRRNESRSFHDDALDRLRESMNAITLDQKPLPSSFYYGAEGVTQTVRMFAQAAVVLGYHGAAWANTLFASHRHCMHQISTFEDFEGLKQWRINSEVKINPWGRLNVYNLPLRSLLDDNQVTPFQFGYAPDKDHLIKNLRWVPLSSQDVTQLSSSVRTCLKEWVEGKW